ncbi:MAG: histidine phosphatase family protein [Candidatus Hermodarchaeota archaeon]
MPNNILIFLRHAETQIEKDIKISRWKLTNKGRNDAFNISKLNLFNDVEIIISSNEDKAYQTAYPLSKKLHIDIIRDRNLNEIVRDQGRFLENREEYLKIMKLCVENRNRSFNNWETGNHAMERFSKRIQEIDSKYFNKKILFVAHGGVINLYFAKILGELVRIFERILTNSFCDYGIIQNGKVLKDIAKI